MYNIVVLTAVSTASEDKATVQGRLVELMHRVMEGSLSLAGRQQAVCEVLDLFDRQQVTINTLQQVG